MESPTGAVAPARAKAANDQGGVGEFTFPPSPPLGVSDLAGDAPLPQVFPGCGESSAGSFSRVSFGSECVENDLHFPPLEFPEDWEDDAPETATARTPMDSESVERSNREVASLMRDIFGSDDSHVENVESRTASASAAPCEQAASSIPDLDQAMSIAHADASADISLAASGEFVSTAGVVDDALGSFVGGLVKQDVARFGRLDDGLKLPWESEFSKLLFDPDFVWDPLQGRKQDSIFPPITHNAQAAHRPPAGPKEAPSGSIFAWAIALGAAARDPAAERERKREQGIGMWSRLVLRYSECCSLYECVSQGLSGREAGYEDVLVAVSAAVGVKSPHTIHKRAASFWTFVRWLDVHEPLAPSRLHEVQVWNFVQFLKETSAPASKAASVLSAFRFAHFVLGFRLSGIVDSKRIAGATEQQLVNVRKLCQAKDLTVSQVLELHARLESGALHCFDRALLASLLIRLYARARPSDFLFVESVEVDCPPGADCPLLVFEVSQHKGARKVQLKTKLLPILVPMIGVHGKCWIDEALTAFRNAGRSLTSVRGKFGFDEDLKSILGRHASSVKTTQAIYSRELSAAPVRCAPAQRILSPAYQAEWNLASVSPDLQLRSMCKAQCTDMQAFGARILSAAAWQIPGETNALLIGSLGNSSQLTDGFWHTGLPSALLALPFALGGLRDFGIPLNPGLMWCGDPLLAFLRLPRKESYSDVEGLKRGEQSPINRELVHTGPGIAWRGLSPHMPKEFEHITFMRHVAGDTGELESHTSVIKQECLTLEKKSLDASFLTQEDDEEEDCDDWEESLHSLSEEAEFPASESSLLTPAEQFCSQLREGKLADVLQLITLLESETPARGQEAPNTFSWTSGAYAKGPLKGVRKHTSVFPACTRLLCKLVLQTFPDADFTAVAIYKNLQTALHVDVNNELGSQNYLIPITAFQGGEVWQKGPGNDIVQDELGFSLSGSLVRVADGPCTLPWTGDRVLLVAFKPNHAASLSPEYRRRLLQAGFPESAFDSASCSQGRDSTCPRGVVPAHLDELPSKPCDNSACITDAVPDPVTWCDPLVIELFSGSGRVTACLKQLGLSAVGVDADKRRSISTCLQADLATPKGQELCMEWLSSLRLAGLFVTPPAHLTDATGQFLAAALLHVLGRGAVCVLAQAGDGTFWKSDCWTKVSSNFTFVSCHECAYEGNHLSTTIFAVTDRSFSKLARFCPGSPGSPCRQERMSECPMHGAYPVRLAMQLACCFAQHFVRKGWRSPPQSFDAFDPRLEVPMSRALAGAQPRASKIPPLVSEHQRVIVLQHPPGLVLPCQPMQRLSKPWPVPPQCGATLAHIPAKAQLLRHVPIVQDGGKELVKVDSWEMAWGSMGSVLPAPLNAELQASMHPDVREITASKRILLWAQDPALAVEVCTKTEKELEAGQKVRCIDNLTSSGVNLAVQAYEAPQPQSTDVVASTCLRLLKSINKRAGKVLFKILGKAFDLTAAYRQMPVHPDTAWAAYICFVHPDTNERVYFRMKAMPFGSSMAVYAFLRISHSLWFLGAKALLLPWSSFFDDFVTFATTGCSASAEASVTAMFKLLGWAFAESGEKSNDFAECFQALGIMVDLHACLDGTISFKNTAKRVSEIKAFVGKVLESGRLPHHEALRLRGRCQFADSQIFGRTGKKCLGLITAHAYGFDEVISRELRTSLERFLLRLEDGAPRLIKILEGGSWHVYTDASYEPGAGNSFCGLGGVLVDPNGSPRKFFSFVLSEAQKNFLGEQNSAQIIFQAEMLAMAVALDVWLEDLTGHTAIFFVDNNGVRDAAISANARASVARRLLESFLQKEHSSAIIPWFARVPSPSNPADEPSRVECDSLNLLGVQLLRSNVSRRMDNCLKDVQGLK
ncbi:unnamed protein product [Symbiodinium sp. CCMP2592]|nr:unnamed protein product [Symbiodinium sp. CCMP2592]